MTTAVSAALPWIAVSHIAAESRGAIGFTQFQKNADFFRW